MKENFLTVLFYLFLLICIFSIWFYYFVLDWNFNYNKIYYSNSNKEIETYINWLDTYKNFSWENIKFISIFSWDCTNCFDYTYSYDYYSWFSDKFTQKMLFKFQWEKIIWVEFMK